MPCLRGKHLATSSRIGASSTASVVPGCGRRKGCQLGRWAPLCVGATKSESSPVQLAWEAFDPLVPHGSSLGAPHSIYGIRPSPRENEQKGHPIATFFSIKRGIFVQIGGYSVRPLPCMLHGQRDNPVFAVDGDHCLHI